MEIRVLGPVQVLADDSRVVHLPARQQTLVAALTARAGETCSFEWLAEAVWGVSPPGSPSRVLQVYVSRLRVALPKAARIRTERRGYALELTQDSLDAWRFERLLAQARASSADGNDRLALSQLDRGLALWRGHAYGDFAYEEFARSEAERLEELRLLAAEERVSAVLRLGRHAELLPELRSLAGTHPLRERLQGQLILALYRCGRQTEALEAFTSFHSRLRDELGLEPGAELRELQRRILEHDPALSIAASAEAATIALPTPPNRLLGRERELRELTEHLAREETRLLVLTGAGGSGKTRLALEVARKNARSFANGATLVELAPLSDPGLVLGAIAAAVGIRDQPGDPVDSLVATLRSREMLLVLDNAEHLLEAAPLYVELLAAAPRLKVLVTSRSVLHLSGERVYLVEPLTEHAATRLFLDRAQAAEPRFQPDENDVALIHRICERLDRLPLAIELAATRTRTLAPAELLDRLDRRLPLLAGGPQDLPARQQTLRATLEWSHELLDQAGQQDFAGLAVFAGSFTLEAAEAILDRMHDRLATLLDHNLIQRTTDETGSRYTMLETIREFALERLEKSGRANELRRKHAQYYADVFERLVRTPPSPTLMRQFICEIDNIRLAFATSRESAAGLVAMRLAAATARYWVFSGAVEEGAQLVRNALAIGGEVPAGLRSRVLEISAELERFRHDVPTAIRLATESRRLARIAKEPELEAQALVALGAALGEAGDLAAAADSLQHALTIYRRAENTYDLPRAAAYLAYIELIRFNFRRAVDLFEEVLQLVGDAHEWARAGNLEKLALAHLHLGHLSKARLLLDESQAINKTLGAEAALAHNLLTESALAAAEGHAGLAARLGGAAEAASESIPTPFDTFERGMKARTEERLVDALGHERFTELWAEGRALDLQQAFAARELVI